MKNYFGALLMLMSIPFIAFSHETKPKKQTEIQPGNEWLDNNAKHINANSVGI